MPYVLHLGVRPTPYSLDTTRRAPSLLITLSSICTHDTMNLGMQNMYVYVQNMYVYVPQCREDVCASVCIESMYVYV